MSNLPDDYQQVIGANYHFVYPNDMTLRDYFAAAALTGLIHKSEQFGFPDRAVDYAAARAYDYADAMLKERNRDDRP